MRFYFTIEEALRGTSESGDPTVVARYRQGRTLEEMDVPANVRHSPSAYYFDEARFERMIATHLSAADNDGAVLCMWRVYWEGI